MSTNFLFFNFVIQLFLTRVPSRKSKQKKKNMKILAKQIITILKKNWQVQAFLRRVSTKFNK